jgi:hypothetical protein
VGYGKPPVTCGHLHSVLGILAACHSEHKCVVGKPFLLIMHPTTAGTHLPRALHMRTVHVLQRCMYK